MPPVPTIRLEPPPNLKWLELGKIFSALVGVLLIIASLLAFIYLILGGIQWITSGGDKTGLESARNKITHAIVGLIIVASSWAIMTLVFSFLGIDLFSPGGFNFPRPY